MILGFYNDREFYTRLFHYAIPIIVQQFLLSSLNLVGVVMIGQLGEAAIAAVGLCNQIFFLLNLLLFGINSGAAIFTAQLWGKGDVHSIRKVLGLALLLGLMGGLFFSVVAELFPREALSIYSRDPQVISLGSEYLKIFGMSFLFTAITFSYAIVLRSTGDVRTPMLVSMGALSLNTLLSYGLIFGNFGLPNLGVRGAAISITIARMIECIALVFLVYRRKTPAAASLQELLSFTRGFAGRVMRRVLPVALNEVLWSLGITTYNIIYARIGTEAIAAMNIAATIDGMAIVFFIGIGNACAILVGNVIGAGEEEKAYRYALRSLGLGVVGGVFIGLLLILMSGGLLELYKVSPIVIDYTRRVLTIIGLGLWLRVANLIMFVGIFRSGGDTRFAFFLDAGTIWIVGVPLAYLGAFIFQLPVYLVYLMVLTDELTKMVIGLFRLFSKKWIHNLTYVA
jgi:putative MATE family efflux protein